MASSVWAVLREEKGKAGSTSGNRTRAHIIVYLNVCHCVIQFAIELAKKSKTGWMELKKKKVVSWRFLGLEMRFIFHMAKAMVAFPDAIGQFT